MQANTVNKTILVKLRCTTTNRLHVTNTRRLYVEQLKEAGQAKLATGWNTGDDHGDKQRRNSQRRMRGPGMTRLTLERNGNGEPGPNGDQLVQHHATESIVYNASRPMRRRQKPATTPDIGQVAELCVLRSFREMGSLPRRSHIYNNTTSGLEDRWANLTTTSHAILTWWPLAGSHFWLCPP